jgi:outer membrane lipoprotein SlyB
MFIYRLSMLLALLGGLTGCMLPASNSFGRESLNSVYTMNYGTVDRVRVVEIEPPESPIGMIAGALLGGIAGGGIGGGRGSDLAAVAGALGGGLLGSAMQTDLGANQGLELTVRLENGQQMVVIQAAEPMFQAGERVRVLTSRDGSIRVTH